MKRMIAQTKSVISTVGPSALRFRSRRLRCSGTDYIDLCGDRSDAADDRCAQATAERSGAASVFLRFDSLRSSSACSIARSAKQAFGAPAQRVRRVRA